MDLIPAPLISLLQGSGPLAGIVAAMMILSWLARMRGERDAHALSLYQSYSDTLTERVTHLEARLDAYLARIEQLEADKAKLETDLENLRREYDAQAKELASERRKVTQLEGRIRELEGKTS